MSILTSQEVLDSLGLSGGRGTSEDIALANQFWPLAENAVKEWLGFDVEQNTYTEFLPESPLLYQSEPIGESMTVTVMPRVREISTNQVPVRSITSLHENQDAWFVKAGDFGSDFLLSEGKDFKVDWSETGLSWSGKLVRFGSWPLEPRCVKVTYVAGLTIGEIEGRYRVFKTACLWTLVKFWNGARAYQKDESGGQGGLVNSESLGGWSVSYDQMSNGEIMGLKATLPGSVKALMRPYLRMSRFLA